MTGTFIRITDLTYMTAGKVLLMAGMVLLIAGCGDKRQDEQTYQQGTAQSATGQRYFSLEEYFDREATRLEQQAPDVLKTVMDNDQPETKTLKIKNWKNELAPFAQADINKPAWKDQYQIDSTGSVLVYTSLDPNLRTSKISIEKKPDGGIRSIRIERATNNSLYNSSEQLHYFPDSLYEIRKQQEVRVIGKNGYLITGKFRF